MPALTCACASVLPAGLSGGCGTWCGWGMVVGLGTLLGPEKSGPLLVRPVGCLGFSWCLPLPARSPVGGVWGLVGLLFEICIVDASIFVAIVLLCL